MSKKTIATPKIQNPEQQPQILVTSEIGTLRRVLVHSPDGGIGKVVPRKAKDLLYEDIVDLPKMQQEYDDFIKILLYFLDPQKIQGEENQKHIQKCKKTRYGRSHFFIPAQKEYFNSDKVVDSEQLLTEILKDEIVKNQLVAAVCALEQATRYQDKLLGLLPNELSKTLITGFLKQYITETETTEEQIFQPIPNFIFSRDICVSIKDHLLLSRTHFVARHRESLLIKYIARHKLCKNNPQNIIELIEDDDYLLMSETEQKEYRITLEGGDVMMISKYHLLVGCSERTSPSAVSELIHQVFERKQANGNDLVRKVTVIRVPAERSWMHIDTIMSHLKKDTWVLFGQLSEKGKQIEKAKGFAYEDLVQGKQAEDKVKIFHFDKRKFGENKPFDDQENYLMQEQSNQFKTLEDLCKYISYNEFGCDEKTQKIKFIYSGDNKFPYDEREQATDSCNLLVLKEGVAIAYDRNRETNKAFENQGFTVITAAELMQQFETKKLTPDKVKNTIILLPSSELSRARGGSHCMSMPLLRTDFWQENEAKL